MAFAVLAVAPLCMAEERGTIAVFGSSVAHGAVDKAGGGYRGRLATLLADRGWDVINVSRGGDNTVTIQPRFEAQLVPADPDYVIIGLSLGNEGIRSDKKEEQQAVFDRFRDGMLDLIRQCREKGMRPVVANCYAHACFHQDHYAHTRRMNLLINTWDVPSINFLGAIDNGAGQWAEGHEADPWHPNSRGHEEMFRAIVPTLFDAMEAGKPIPVKVEPLNCARILRTDGVDAPLEFVAGDPIHAHAVGFWVRSDGTGTIAGLTGESGSAYVAIEPGRITYNSPVGTSISAAIDQVDGWHHILVSHRYCIGQTMFFVDGTLAGSVEEAHQPRRFVLGGGGSDSQVSPPGADYRDWFVWRSALNEDEAKVVHEGGLLQSSLEIYAPLQDAAFADGTPVVNVAQSMAEAVVHGSGIERVALETDTRD